MKSEKDLGLWSDWTGVSGVVMTHKYRECIVVLSINRSVDPNEEQKVLTSGVEQKIYLANEFLGFFL